MSLDIKNLHVAIGTDEIINGLDLNIKKGEVHVIMGPNGSGKSSLANTLGGHPKYSVTSGSITIDETDVTEEKADERARKGLFLSQQYPPEIPGVTVANFLRVASTALTGVKKNPIEYHKELVALTEKMKVDSSFLGRHLNVGFSGGEKKKFEILQLLALDPTYAILDETDSGLDVDALKVVAEGINDFKDDTKGILLITHYHRILDYITPDVVHIMVGGKIVKSGEASLAKKIEEEGYDNF
jgi:Fe-S cluster assembly ATP-binding protein